MAERGCGMHGFIRFAMQSTGDEQVACGTCGETVLTSPGRMP